MIRAVLYDRDMREIASPVIRSHVTGIVLRKVRELMREYPAADWLELYYHDGSRLVSCQINRFFERQNHARIDIARIEANS